MSANNPISYHLYPNRVLLSDISPIVEGDYVGTDPIAGAAAASSKSGEGPHYTIINCDGLARLALMVTPTGGGEFRDQLWETISLIRAILQGQKEPTRVTLSLTHSHSLTHTHTHTYILTV